MANDLKHTGISQADCPACLALMEGNGLPAPAATNPRVTRGECVDHTCSHRWEIECSGTCPTTVVADKDVEIDAHDPDTCDDDSCEDAECRFRTCDHNDITITSVELDCDNDIFFEVRCDDCGGINSSYVPRNTARGELTTSDWEP